MSLDNPPHTRSALTAGPNPSASRAAIGQYRSVGERFVTDPTVADRTVERLRRMVITRELPPGTLASESRLARTVGCGRTPLREALQRLSHEYLVRIRPRQGILIPELSIVDLQQICEALLYLVIPHTPELAATRISRSQTDGLVDIVKRAEQAEFSKDFYELTQLDWRFHAVIAEATQNRYVSDAGKRLHSSLARFVYAAYEAADTGNQSTAEHQAIVEALSSQNPDLTRQRLRDHIIDGRQRLLDILGVGGLDLASQPCAETEEKAIAMR